MSPIRFTHININGIDEEMETYTLETTVDGHTKIAQFTDYPLFAAHTFHGLIMQAAKDPRPCIVKISKKEKVWLELSQKFRILDSSLEFKNNAYCDAEAD